MLSHVSFLIREDTYCVTLGWGVPWFLFRGEAYPLVKIPTISRWVSKSCTLFLFWMAHTIKNSFKSIPPWCQREGQLSPQQYILAPGRQGIYLPFGTHPGIVLGRSDIPWQEHLDMGCHGISFNERGCVAIVCLSYQDDIGGVKEEIFLCKSLSIF